LSSDEPKTDREWLMRIDGKVDTLITRQTKIETLVYGEDGQGGLCGAVSDLKNQQSRLTGRDGAIVVGIPILISLVGLWFMHGGV
jgi:hypothetical protein